MGENAAAWSNMGVQNKVGCKMLEGWDMVGRWDRREEGELKE